MITIHSPMPISIPGHYENFILHPVVDEEKRLLGLIRDLKGAQYLVRYYDDEYDYGYHVHKGGPNFCGECGQRMETPPEVPSLPSDIK